MHRRRKRSATIFASLLLVACAAAFADRPAVGQTVTRSPGGHFEFHLDPWVALHHLAYHHSRAQIRDRRLRGRVALSDQDRSAMESEALSECAELTSAYRPYIAGDLRADDRTRALAEALIGGVDALPDTAVGDALTRCLPAYLEVLWPAHSAASERLLDRLLAQLREHESTMALRLAETLEGAWPNEPIRVDIVPYANWAGAYTDDSPANITISSYDADVAGPHAFELLFHEAGHTISFETSIRSAATAALRETGIESNRYWHFLLFFAAGRLTSEVLLDPSYTPYSVATGLAERDGAAAYYRALAETWDSADSLKARALLAAQRVAAGQ